VNLFGATMAWPLLVAQGQEPVNQLHRPCQGAIAFTHFWYGNFWVNLEKWFFYIWIVLHLGVIEGGKRKSEGFVCAGFFLTWRTISIFMDRGDKRRRDGLSD
jgi:hypothetical protein